MALTGSLLHLELEYLRATSLDLADIRNRQKYDVNRESRLDQRRVPIDHSAVGPIASPRLSRRHIGGLTPSAPITTAAASEPSFFIMTKTLRPTAS
jgi:hypothetical protein